ncbi:unnamed protein product [Owenia fusiformis]|uniref:Receptor ligand binding region domain-containing protein n=1 Tax=Owenia fusiformis TaxID=6347 RepID=A0A8S4NV64_OWEFU|nr:unnamed protein product [Owenia fusiformis]
MRFSSIFLLTFGVIASKGDGTYPRPSELNATKPNILIGGLLPLDITFSRRLMTAAQIAIDEINKRNDVLKDYNLVLHMKNTSVGVQLSDYIISTRLQLFIISSITSTKKL